jgi:hypothetical protein
VVSLSRLLEIFDDLPHACIPSVHTIGGSLSDSSSCLSALIGEIGLGSSLIILFEKTHYLPDQHVLMVLTG